VKVPRLERSQVRLAAGALALVPLLLVAVTACGRRGPQGPTREEVTTLLQQEAQALKATGEKLDPVLRVKATWTVAELTVHDRPADPDKPWSGLVKFHIRAETKDSFGGTQVDEFDKRFDYLWSTALHRWLIQPAAK
jgi:predicted small lipoprotein YifL